MRFVDFYYDSKFATSTRPILQDNLQITQHREMCTGLYRSTRISETPKSKGTRGRKTPGPSSTEADFFSQLPCTAQAAEPQLEITGLGLQLVKISLKNKNNYSLPISN